MIHRTQREIMGIDLYCNKCDFACSYSIWNDIRCEIIRNTYSYLKEVVGPDIETPSSVVFSEQQTKHYHVLMKHMEDILDIHQKMYTIVLGQSTHEMDADELYNFNRSYADNMDFTDGLIAFGLYGLYALCHKNDCEGFYSPGNAFDIVQLFERIHPFVDKSIEKNKHRVYYPLTQKSFRQLIEMFQESIDTKDSIIIS